MSKQVPGVPCPLLLSVGRFRADSVSICLAESSEGLPQVAESTCIPVIVLLGQVFFFFFLMSEFYGHKLFLYKK